MNENYEPIGFEETGDINSKEARELKAHARAWLSRLIPMISSFALLAALTYLFAVGNLWNLAMLVPIAVVIASIVGLKLKTDWRRLNIVNLVVGGVFALIPVVMFLIMAIVFALATQW